jgi:hypothetical protein
MAINELIILDGLLVRIILRRLQFRLQQPS